MPRIARRRRQPRSWSASCRSTRPGSPPARSARARSPAWPRGRATRAAPAPGRRGRRRPARRAGRCTAQRRPSREISRRWIAAARSDSISCSQIAQASASNGCGRPVTRRPGVGADRDPDQRIEAKPLVERPQRSWSTPSAWRIRSIPHSAAARSIAPARRTAPARRRAARRGRAPARRRRAAGGEARRRGHASAHPGRRGGAGGTATRRLGAHLGADLERLGPGASLAGLGDQMDVDEERPAADDRQHVERPARHVALRRGRACAGSGG